MTVRTANVPNKVLQSGFDVRVFGYDGKATMHETTFEVKARTQPTDYVYTEVEIKRYSDLEARIDEIEENGISEEVISNAVYNYLEENPVDMTGYATEEYVNEAVSNVKPDLTGLATEAYVDEAVTKAKPDLTDYAKKTDIPDVSKFITSIPSEYVTESELESKGYAKASALNDKANTNHTHSEYAKTKHTHDMADVNGLQNALSNKASQADIDKAIELHNHDSKYAPLNHSHGDEYAAKSHTHSYNNLLDKPTIPSVEGLASEAYVNAAIANIKIPEGESVDLSNYYTKEETDQAIYNSKDSYYLDFRNATTESQPATEDMIEFATRYLEDQNVCAHVMTNQNSGNPVKGYQPVTAQKLINTVRLTANGMDPANTEVSNKVQYYSYDIRNDSTAGWVYRIYQTYSFALATKEYIDEAIANIDIPEGGESADLTNYYTKTEVNTNFATKQDLATDLDNLALAFNDVLTGYYTKTETNQAIQDALSAIGVAEEGSY